MFSRLYNPVRVDNTHKMTGKQASIHIPYKVMLLSNKWHEWIMLLFIADVCVDFFVLSSFAKYVRISFFSFHLFKGIVSKCLVTNLV